MSSVDGSTCSAETSIVSSAPGPHGALPCLSSTTGSGSSGAPRTIASSPERRASFAKLVFGRFPGERARAVIFVRKFRGRESPRLERTSSLPHFHCQLSAGAPWCGLLPVLDHRLRSLESAKDDCLVA